MYEQTDGIQMGIKLYTILQNNRQKYPFFLHILFRLYDFWSTLFVRLCVINFLENRSIIFSEISYDVIDPSGLKSVRAQFF